jgi:hypothetical protein
VASDNRYAYWTVIAVLLAAIIGFDQARALMRPANRAQAGVLALMLVVIIAGMAARLFNLTVFVL